MFLAMTGQSGLIRVLALYMKKLLVLSNHGVNSEDSDVTGLMFRMIKVLTDHTVCFGGIVIDWLSL